MEKQKKFRTEWQCSTGSSGGRVLKGNLSLIMCTVLEIGFENIEVSSNELNFFFSSLAIEINTSTSPVLDIALLKNLIPKECSKKEKSVE